MNFAKFPVLFLFFISLILSANTTVKAQDNEGGRGGGSLPSVSSFNLNFSSFSDGYYYQDALSATLGNQLFTSDGEIDINNYVLGPNDLITVSLQGAENIVLRALLVNPQGDVVLPMLGAVNVAGQTISEAQKTINDSAKSVFSAPNAHISLERPRPLVVQVSGNVEYPGKHHVPPFSRVDAAIYGAIFEVNRSGNISNMREETGTVELLEAGPLALRNITIEHRDGTKDTADLVAYFKAGDLEKNPMVEYGDRITIRRLTNESPRVSISGAVMEGNEFEYSSTDTPELLLEIAGGFKPEADTSKIFVFRNENGTQQKIEVPRSDWSSFDILPNDRLIVPTNRDLNASASAWVHGEVITPGNYPIKNGQTTALELLTLSGDLTDRALPSAAYLMRAGSSENEIPNEFNTDVLKRTSDQLVQGFEYLDLETNLSQNKVFVDVTDDEQLAGVKIYDGDRLYVPRDEQTVFVFGQVNNPGYYPYTKTDQNVSDYINRAGGFALSANKERTFIIKAGSGTWFHPNETELESGDRIFVDRVPYDELNAQRTFEVQKEQIKNTRIQLIMTGISTITGIITTYVAIQNIRN